MVTYELKIKEDINTDTEVSAVALVDVPAIGVNFLAFQSQEFVDPKEGESQDDFMQRCIPAMINEGKDQEQAAAICYSKWEGKSNFQKFAVVNEEEKLIVGPALIPEMLIYRRDPDGKEYNVKFSADTVEKIALKFFAKNFQTSGNEQHDNSKPVDLVFYMSWIADEKKGIPKMKQFEHLPDGTWFLGAKIKDDAAWSKVKDGTFNGFSVEGLFDMIPVTDPVNVLEQLKQILKQI